jgi:hypothetical protein
MSFRKECQGAGTKGEETTVPMKPFTAAGIQGGGGVQGETPSARARRERAKRRQRLNEDRDAKEWEGARAQRGGGRKGVAQRGGSGEVASTGQSGPDDEGRPALLTQQECSKKEGATEKRGRSKTGGTESDDDDEMPPLVHDGSNSEVEAVEGMGGRKKREEHGDSDGMLALLADTSDTEPLAGGGSDSGEEGMPTLTFGEWSEESEGEAGSEPWRASTERSRTDIKKAAQMPKFEKAEVIVFGDFTLDEATRFQQLDLGPRPENNRTPDPHQGNGSSPVRFGSKDSTVRTSHSPSSLPHPAPAFFPYPRHPPPYLRAEHHLPFLQSPLPPHFAPPRSYYPHAPYNNSFGTFPHPGGGPLPFNPDHLYGRPILPPHPYHGPVDPSQTLGLSSAPLAVIPPLSTAWRPHPLASPPPAQPDRAPHPPPNLSEFPPGPPPPWAPPSLHLPAAGASFHHERPHFSRAGHIPLTTEVRAASAGGEQVSTSEAEQQPGSEAGRPKSWAALVGKESTALAPVMSGKDPKVRRPLEILRSLLPSAPPVYITLEQLSAKIDSSSGARLPVVTGREREHHSNEPCPARQICWAAPMSSDHFRFNLFYHAARPTLPNTK